MLVNDLLSETTGEAIEGEVDTMTGIEIDDDTDPGPDLDPETDTQVDDLDEIEAIPDPGLDLEIDDETDTKQNIFIGKTVSNKIKSSNATKNINNLIISPRKS